LDYDCPYKLVSKLKLFFEILEFQIRNFSFNLITVCKTPEPFDVNIDILLGNDSILHRLHYTNCDVVDITWYLQEGTWLYQYAEIQREEIRERYAVYCEGFPIEFP